VCYFSWLFIVCISFNVLRAFNCGRTLFPKLIRIVSNNKPDGFFFLFPYFFDDCLCVLVGRVPGYRSRGPGFDSRRYQIF
jgi:hypothetical protein